jgi:Xaa-Pro dipeptidase
MRSLLPLKERDRRWVALSEAMRQESLDGLVFTSNDHRGHKGALRYVADYNLGHRFGYAVMGPDREPVGVLPFSMAGSPRGPWISDFRFPMDTAIGLRDALLELPACDRIGIVGLGQVMRVRELEVLRSELPGTEFVDASALFDRIRVVKSHDELRAFEEASWIADSCLDRLLEIARPGMTERALFAETLRSSAMVGGEDPIFLVMSGARNGDHGQPIWRVPGDEVLEPSSLFMFSFELIGPSGYWVELARMVTFTTPSAEQLSIHAAVRSAMEEGCQALVPGGRPSDVHASVVAAAAEHAAAPGYWSGHSIGLDVIEGPWIGLEVVESVDSSATEASAELAGGMVFALHPFLVPDDDGPVGYMANTYVVEDGAARQLSRHPLDIYQVT